MSVSLVQNMNTRKASKFLSLILRHKPETINIKLDSEGWVSVTDLLAGMHRKGWDTFTKENLEEVVKDNNKQRFSFNESKTKIRANQGHSIQVDLGLKPTEPPDNLFHGTVSKFMDSIKSEGLKKVSRQHVHLSVDITTANNVGSRRGKPVILTINSRRMYDDGYTFYLSKNGVWLTDQVPYCYIDFSATIYH